MKLLRSIFTLVAVFLPTISGQFIVDADCTACSIKCRWWDLKCASYKWFCNVVAGFAENVVKQIENVCVDDAIGLENRDMIAAANDLLVERGIYTQEELEGVDVRFCSKLKNGVPGLTLLGFTPSADLIWLDVSWLNADAAEFAILMAHEYVHIQQWREYDDKFILCEYAENTLSGVPAEEIWIEVEAYGFQENVTDCITDNIDCPQT